ncbi:hypothetical protein ACWGJ2_30675 [Streptomyces sp. NPDC054796]
MTGHACEVEGGNHLGPAVRYVATARYPWHAPVWLCPRHGTYLPIAAVRAHVTGESVARAIAVFTGAGNRLADTEATEPEPDPEQEPEPAPTLRVVRTPSLPPATDLEQPRAT